MMEEDMEIQPETPTPHRNHRHANDAFQKLNQYRKHSVLCDVVIVCAGLELPAHKAILSSCSPYFQAMFTTNLSEASADRIEMQDTNAEALSMLLDYVYTGEIAINEDSVQILLPVANLLQLSDVRIACCDFLQSQLHPSNCLGIRRFADLHACTELYSLAQIYTEQHFSDVVQHDEYLQLEPQAVSNLISSDQLTVLSEEHVFEAVITWIAHDKGNKHVYLPQLLENVRLPLLPQEYLIQRVGEENLINANAHCKDLLIEALKFHLLKGDQKILVKSPRTKPRTPIGLPKLMLVMGGQAPKAIKCVEIFDFKDEKWSQATDMPSRRCRCGVAVHNNLAYAIGGFNGSLRVRTVDVYDPVKESWASVSYMEARRSTLGAAVLNGHIYAVGGFDGSAGLSSVECYDPKVNEWKMISPMTTRRSSVGVGVAAGLLYAVGGYDGASRHCLSSVECYNSEMDTWSLVAEMSCKRSGAGVGVLENILYAVGGHDGPLVRKSVEMYNPQTNQWRPVANMHVCRRNAGVVTYNGFIYAVGGDDGSANLQSVEYYNPKTDEWTLLPSCMTTGRSYAGVAIIDKPL